MMRQGGEKGARVTRIGYLDKGVVTPLIVLTGDGLGKPRAQKLPHPYNVMVSPNPPRQWCMKSL